ncbi:MAG: efflux RND transporter permease subunit [Rhizobiaceae bacterium]|nr:MAG: efflux RND transporter permease subunit [Rhizobiaceae bacterium]
MRTHLHVRYLHRRNRHLLAQSMSPEPRKSTALSNIDELAVIIATEMSARMLNQSSFVPVLSLSGVAGRLFAPLGMAYIMAVIASLIIAVTLTPAMSLALLANRGVAQHEPRLLTRLKADYGRLLATVERHARAIIAAVMIAGVAALGALPFLQTSYIPELKEGSYTVHVGLAPGTSLEESMRIGGHISKALMAIPGVRLVAQRAGRADEVVDPVGVQLSEFEVGLKLMGPDNEERTVRQIRSTLARFPGITTSINTFLVERIDETISGTPAPVVISVFGNDLDNIDRVSLQIAHLVASMRGATSVQVESPPGTPELSVRLDQTRLSRWGFTPVEVMNAIQSAYQGITVAQEYQGVRSYDVSVVMCPADRKDIGQVGSLLLRNPDGLMVPLRDLAQLQQVSGRYQITHDGGRRVQVISVTVGGRSIAGFVSEAQRRVDREITMPKGTYAVFSGESEALGRSQRDLLVYGLMAGLSVVLFLFLALKSRRAVALVLFNVPFALVGGVGSVMLTGGSLSLGGMVGFVTLFGISLRNSIMLVGHYQHLVEKEGMLWSLETAVRGASERLVPILMTAIVTALALLPLAITSGEAGNEIEGPMAVVILGGLVTSTLLNLFVLPTLALRYGRFDGTGVSR